jgi:hypothetical protein
MGWLTMTEFEINYLGLLSSQVNEEIAFLKLYNHGKTNNYPRCLFCYQTRQGNYNCARIDELKQFQSNIAIERNKEKTINRRPIGEVNVQEFTPVNSLQLSQLLEPF